VVDNAVVVPPLHKVGEDATTITLGWTPVTGAYGYRFFEDGKPVSWTANPLLDHTKFSKVGKDGNAIMEYAVLTLFTRDKPITYNP
jgi:hypothetical protein